MSYTNVQFIAYEVPTGTPLPAGQCDLDKVQICQAVEGDEVFKQAFSALSQDARVRITRLLTIIDLTRSSGAARAAKDTLKVFVAPEFYLRPEEQGTASRSYAASDMVAAQSLFRLVFSQAMLQGWMGVLGTIVWNMKGKVALSGATTGSDDRSKYLDGLQKLATKDLVYNTAVVGIGGAGVQLYDKVYYSGADDIADKRWPLQGYSMQSSTQCVVAADNLHCGLEVCRDHQQRLLSTTYDSIKKLGGSPPALDLQLLTACGMTVQRSSVVLGQQRYVFRVDGAVAEDMEGNGRFDHSEVQLVTKADKRGATEIANAATASQQWKTLNTPDVAVDLTGDLKVNVTGAKGYLQPKDTSKSFDLVEKDLDEVFKQRLVVYPYRALSHLAS